MKFNTLIPLKVLLLCIVTIFQFSCSKDSDLLTDYVLSDTLDAKGIGNIVVDDTYHVSLTGSIVLDVLENDTFENEAEVVITETSTPTNGTVAINNDETLTYTPNAEIVEQLSDTTNTTIVEVVDTFSYTTEVVNEDASVSTETGNVTVNIGSSDRASTSANLLFSSGFETTTVVEPLTAQSGNNGYQYITGTDSSRGYAWNQTLNGLWGSSGNGIHVINQTGQVTNEIQTVTGHLGGPTKALHTKIDYNNSGPGTQSPYQINKISNDPDEYYISMWVKFDGLTELVDTSKWSMVWQYKSDKWYENDGFVLEGRRISIFLVSDSQGNRYFKTVVDKGSPSADWLWNSSSNGIVQIPTNTWFHLEMFGKISSTASGRFWAKVDGVQIADYYGSTIGPVNDSLGFMMLTQFYGTITGERWFDDIEIWDGVPY